MKRLPVVILAALVFTIPAGSALFADTGVVPGEGDEFVVSFLSGGIQLNPVHSYTSSEAQIYSGIYEGLVNYHPLTMEPVPAAAESWTVSDDGLVYTFTLRENAVFSDGTPVTAEDFRATWFRLIDPEINAAYNFLFDVIDGVREYRAGQTKNRDSVGIQAVDTRTLKVTLRNPATHFLRILCHHAFVPLHPSLRRTDDWSAIPSLPVNGPYRITERTESHIVLDKNSRYWDAKSVKIPRIRILLTDENDAEKITDQFNRGLIDWVTGGMDLGTVQFPDTVVLNPLFATTYYFFRSDVEPFDNPKVRRALALLLPWQEIRSDEIQFIPATTLVPEIPYYPRVSGITEPNVEEALELLKEAGYSRGVRIPTIEIHIPQGSESARVAGLMKDAWEKHLELSVDITVTPYPAYFDALSESDFTVGTVSWIGDFADPLTFLQMWISDSNVNDAGFSDPRYDALIDDSMVLRGQERYNRLGQAEEILLQTGTVLPVSHSPAINLIDLNAVDGWYPNPLDIHPMKYFRFTEQAPLPGVI
ncbi:MAG: peptide ABC transporter substrate-binding protein [Alkalispirochaeta sp.]